MAFTQADLDNLDAAIATGELKVEVNGRSVIYRSIPELIQARTLIAQMLSAAGSDGNGKKTHGAAYRYTFTTSRGE